MRIWDIDAGFLNGQSLLGEHRELHGIFSILQNNKKGYSRHPETLRWQGRLKSLEIRHGLIVEEMHLRGFNHQSPVSAGPGDPVWPEAFIDLPRDQFGLLKTKYRDKKPGRIPLPKNALDLWAFHKYSVMARDPGLYRTMGPDVARNRISFETLCRDLVPILRTPPEKQRLVNAVDHMWGYVSGFPGLHHHTFDPGTLLQEIQQQAFLHDVSYLIRSTALAELKFWHTFSTKNKGD